jgi:hypothetical protein
LNISTEIDTLVIQTHFAVFTISTGTDRAILAFTCQTVLLKPTYVVGDSVEHLNAAVFRVELNNFPNGSADLATTDFFLWTERLRTIDYGIIIATIKGDGRSTFARKEQDPDGVYASLGRCETNLLSTATFTTLRIPIESRRAPIGRLVCGITIPLVVGVAFCSGM